MDDIETVLMNSSKSIQILLSTIDMLKIAHSENIRCENELIMAIRASVIFDQSDPYLNSFNDHVNNIILQKYLIHLNNAIFS